jgi:hypothetical protein
LYYDESYSSEEYYSYEDYGESYEDEESYEMSEESSGPFLSKSNGRAFSWWGTVGNPKPADNPYGTLNELYWGLPRPGQTQAQQ